MSNKPNKNKVSEAIAGVAASSPVGAPSDNAGAAASKGESSIPQPSPAVAPAKSEKSKSEKPAAKPEVVQNVPGKFHKFQK